MINSIGGVYSPVGGYDLNRIRNSGEAAEPDKSAASQSPSIPSLNTQDSRITGQIQRDRGPLASRQAPAQGAAETKNEKQLRPNQSKQGATAEGEAGLSEEEQKQLRELQETDRKVRQHEMAHLAAASGIAVSGANFQYQRGPDGMNYAVGGDVRIDTSRESTPERTISKAQRIVAAALAPADPSPQDRSVAASARQMEAKARAELSQQKLEDTQNPELTGNEGIEPNTAPSALNGKNTDETAPGTSSSSGVSPNGFNRNSPMVSPFAASDRAHPGIEVYRRTQESVGPSAFSNRVNIAA